MKRALLLLPCWLSPIALAAPWAAVPVKIAMGWGGYAFFEGWLTKYPNFGPVNRHVLLGMICVIGLAIVPFMFAAFAMLSRSPRRPLVWAMIACEVIFFVPVLVELDLGLWILGLWGYPPWSIPHRPALVGPVLHVTSLLSMCLFALQQRRQVARPVEAGFA